MGLSVSQQGPSQSFSLAQVARRLGEADISWGGYFGGSWATEPKTKDNLKKKFLKLEDTDAKHFSFHTRLLFFLQDLHLDAPPPPRIYFLLLGVSRKVIFVCTPIVGCHSLNPPPLQNPGPFDLLQR